MTSQPTTSMTRTWFWFVLIGTLVGAAVAFGVAAVTPAAYTAHVTVLVAPTPKATGVSNDDLQVAQAYIPTLAELATIRPLLDRVISTTGAHTDAETLARVVTTHVPVGTSLLIIGVSDQDAGTSAALANAIAAQLPSYASPASTGSASTDGLRLDLTVVDPATAPTIRDGPGLPIRMALGGVIALFLTISVVFLVENVGRGAQSFGRGLEKAGRKPQSVVQGSTAMEGAGNPTYGATYPPTPEPTANKPTVSVTPPADVVVAAADPRRDRSGRFRATRKA